MQQDNLEDNETADANNNSAESLCDFVPTLAEIIWTLILTLHIDAGLSSADLHCLLHQSALASNDDAFAALMLLLAEQCPFTKDAAFIVGEQQRPPLDDRQAGSSLRRSLAICNSGEAASLVLDSVPEGLVRHLIERLLGRSESSDSWYWRSLKRVDSCPCSDPFHQFVRRILVGFLFTASYTGAATPTSELSNNARQNPAVRVQYNRRRFRHSWFPFLLEFQRYAESARVSAEGQIRGYLSLLCDLISRAVQRALHSSKICWPPDCPPRCPSALASARVSSAPASSERTRGTNQAAPGRPNLLRASRSQSDFDKYGDAAGSQCMSMAAVFARAHQFLGGSLGNLTPDLLDHVLDIGNELHCGSCDLAGLKHNRHLDYDQLNQGMRQFDTQGWPAFVDEFNSSTWDDLTRRIRDAFTHGRDGLILIANGRAVTVVRDRSDNRLCLFDSHGTSLEPPMPQPDRNQEPAYLIRFDTLQELIMNLRSMFGDFNYCECHPYQFADE